MSQSLRLKKAKVSAGFTLMEVMVALVILTIGLMSIALLMARVFQGTVRSRYMAIAANLASEKIEELNSYSLSDARAHVASGTGGSLTADLGPIAVGGTTVDYYDTVTLNNATGAMNQTYEILAPDGTTVEYVTQSFSADGILRWDSADGYPSVPASTPPPGVTFNRRWTVQANTPSAGLTLITVLVTLKDLTITPQGTPPITFQMSTVRP